MSKRLITLDGFQQILQSCIYLVFILSEVGIILLIGELSYGIPCQSTFVVAELLGNSLNYAESLFAYPSASRFVIAV